MAAATGGATTFFLGGGLLVGEGGFFVRGGAQVEAGLRGEDGSEAKSPMESVIGSKNETAAEIYRQFENAMVLAPYLAEIAGSIGEGGSEKKGGKGEAETEDGNYKVPEGGGGVTDNIKIGNKEVTFGHGGRHLEGTNLSISDVNQAIANDVITRNLGTGQFYKGQVNVNGINIEYTSYGVEDAVINIGTYYPK